MSFQVRLRLTKSLLKCSERLCFGLGFACLVLYAAILSHIWFFQAHESWVFEQALSGKPTSATGVIGFTEKCSSR